MSLSGTYGPADDAKSPLVLAKAVELGCTFWDTAIAYGLGGNESLIGDYFKANGDREKVFVASKCGYNVSWPTVRSRDSVPRLIKVGNSTDRL